MSDFDKPFRITIEYYDKKYTVETNRSDVSIEEFWSLLSSVTKSAGFYELLIDYLGIEDE